MLLSIIAISLLFWVFLHLLSYWIDMWLAWFRENLSHDGIRSNCFFTIHLVSFRFIHSARSALDSRLSLPFWGQEVGKKSHRFREVCRFKARAGLHRQLRVTLLVSTCATDYRTSATYWWWKVKAFVEEVVKALISNLTTQTIDLVMYRPSPGDRRGTDHPPKSDVRDGVMGLRWNEYWPRPMVTRTISWMSAPARWIHRQFAFPQSGGDRCFARACSYWPCFETKT